jgi:hypothetical protein
MVEQALIRAIKQRDFQIGDGQTLRKIAESLIDRAISGDLMAFKELADRLDGKPKQQLEHSGTDGGALVLQVITGVPAADSDVIEGSAEVIEGMVEPAALLIPSLEGKSIDTP